MTVCVCRLRSPILTCLTHIVAGSKEANEPYLAGGLVGPDGDVFIPGTSPGSWNDVLWVVTVHVDLDAGTVLHMHARVVWQLNARLAAVQGGGWGC